MVAVSSFLMIDSFGHGLGGETFQPRIIENKSVTFSSQLEVASNTDPTNRDRKISFSLVNSNSLEPIKNVTYLIKAYKSNIVLFEKTFQSNDGTMIFIAKPDGTDKVEIDESKQGIFDSLFGNDEKQITLKSTIFEKGGLYKFKVSILTIDSFENMLDIPTIYDVSMSLADTTQYKIYDNIYEDQVIGITSYYDLLSSFNYDADSQSINFDMPFDWSLENVNQISNIHQEVIVPKTFTDFLGKKFFATINNFPVSDETIMIDDSPKDNRIIHFMVSQKELIELSKKIENQEVMKFSLSPDKNSRFPISTLTENSEFIINLSLDPQNIISGAETKFLFNFQDVYLLNKIITAKYNVSVFNGLEEIFKESGDTKDFQDSTGIILLKLPEKISNSLTVKFEKIQDSKYANAEFVFKENKQKDPLSTKTLIPDWVKNNAGWWSQDLIDDDNFLNGIQYLIKVDIIKTPQTNQLSNQTSDEIPTWIKDNADWWSQGLISDNDFVKGIQYLVEQGIIRV